MPIARPPDLILDLIKGFDLPDWWMAEHSKPMPCGTIGVQSRAGEPCRFTIPLAYRIGVEPMSSTFGGSRSSAELPVAIVQPRHSNSSQPIALSLVNQATTSYVLPIELSAERLGLAATSAPD